VPADTLPVEPPLPTERRASRKPVPVMPRAGS
jgi:hypothetical protein